MRIAKNYLNTLVVLLGVAGIVGCAASNSGTLHNEWVTLRVVGNEPFTRLVATLNDGRELTVSPDSPEYSRLWRLQGQQVIIREGTGKETPGGPLLIVKLFEIPRQE